MNPNSFGLTEGVFLFCFRNIATESDRLKEYKEIFFKTEV